jgi:hypothetical protein
LPHKDFSNPARPFDSIFDSKAKALVGMTDDEAAYIEAKGCKASVVPDLSIIHHFANFCGSNAGALRSAMPDADFLQNLHLCPPLGGNADSFCSARAFPSLTDAVEKDGSSSHDHSFVALPIIGGRSHLLRFQGVARIH